MLRTQKNMPNLLRITSGGRSAVSVMCMPHSQFSRLKQKYREVNKTLGQTGAGVRPEDVEEGSDMHNLIGRQIVFDCNHVLTPHSSPFCRLPLLEASPWLLAYHSNLQSIFTFCRAWPGPRSTGTGIRYRRQKGEGQGEGEGEGM